jgi:hypothetical protein
MSGPAADFIPTALACWLALSYIFLGKAPRPGPARLAVSLIAAAAALLAPVKGWMVLQWIAVFEPELSVTVTAMLFAGLVSRAGGPKLVRPCDWNSALTFGAIGALLLFPATIGLSSVDIYSWGWGKGFVLPVGLLTLGLLLKGNRFGAILLIGLLVLFLRPEESRNAWDVLIDPVYGAVAVVVVLFRILSFFRPEKKMS